MAKRFFERWLTSRSSVFNVCSRRFCSVVSTMVVTTPCTIAAFAMIGIDPHLEPAYAVLGGNTELETFRIAGGDDVAFGGADALCLRRRQYAVAVGGVGRPWRAHVARPHGFHVAILVENGNAGIVQRVKKSPAKLHSAFGGMQSDDFITPPAVVHCLAALERIVFATEPRLNGSF